jgi:hypothetical protein
VVLALAPASGECKVVLAITLASAGSARCSTPAYRWIPKRMLWGVCLCLFLSTVRWTLRRGCVAAFVQSPALRHECAEPQASLKLSACACSARWLHSDINNGKDTTLVRPSPLLSLRRSLQTHYSRLTLGGPHWLRPQHQHGEGPPIRSQQ